VQSFRRAQLPAWVATSGAHWGQAPEIYTDHASLMGRPDGGASPGD